jgi:hypothetical protein
MDSSNANVEPYRRYHDFHERLNESLKVLTASACHTVAFLEEPHTTQTLGDLIKAADPSWRFPPVWEPPANLAQSMIGSIGRLGIVNVWSALDDFRVGIEAEIERWEAFAKVKLNRHDVSESEESCGLLQVLLNRFGWRRPQQENLLTVLRYFGLVRNCIAHRNSRASLALATLSASSDLKDAYLSLADRPDRILPSFEPDGEVLLHPKLAILYSHLSRLLAMQVNAELVSVLGIDGILNMTAWHASSGERPAGRLPKTAEATLNCLLTERYLVRLANNLEAPRRLRELGLWDSFSRSCSITI